MKNRKLKTQATMLLLTATALYGYHVTTNAEPITMAAANTTLSFQHDKTIPPATDKAAMPNQAEMDKNILDATHSMQAAIKTYQAPETLADRLRQDPRFPMRSALTPGKVLAQRVHLPLHVPTFYLVGDDPISIAWLKQHHSTLQQLHAIGFITNVDTKARLEALQTQFGITLHPVALDGLENHLPVTHYPFWYEKGYIQQ